MGSSVLLYIYDLSRGLAEMVAPVILGKSIGGIWHTSIVVYDTEYYFGSSGIQTCTPGSTYLGAPQKHIALGVSHVPLDIFNEYVQALGETTFGPTTYSLLTHNCNNFSDELAQFLCSVRIPQYILDLPQEAINSPLGNALVPIAEQLEQRIGSSNASTSIGHQIANFFTSGMSHTHKSRNGNMRQLELVRQMEEEERQEEQDRKRNREPPIIYSDVLDINVEFDVLVGLIDGKINLDEQTSLEELHKFMLEGEGSWILSEHSLAFFDRLLNDQLLPVEVRIRTLNVLALAALKDDFIILLHQDRRDHVLMTYAYNIDRHSYDEQVALATLICNMFDSVSSSEWLLYITEWSCHGLQTSNIRVTTKVAVHALLAEKPALQDRGAAIIHNLACKEVKTVVFDDVAVELTMALLQYFQHKPKEENLYIAMKSLAKFVQVSRHEVSQLIQMIGPDPKSFRGTSARIDELIDVISSRA